MVISRRKMTMVTAGGIDYYYCTEIIKPFNIVVPNYWLKK